jgi:2-polyprenyl-3-methyl-5-hydroxy-6-metoxy-1,4-benzoquinol methylase
LTICPACGSATGCGSNDFIAVCRSCGHGWLNRSEQSHAAVEASLFTRDYAGYRPDAAYVAAVTTSICEQLVPRVPPPGRLLDLGCGAGDLLLAAREFGYEVEGIDISAASAEICRSRGLQCAVGDFLTREFPHRFDVIVMWDVLAHLRDPESFLARSRSLLTARGILLLKTPLLGDISVGLGRRWPRAAGALLGAPSHSQYFNRRSLAALLSRAGFQGDWMDLKKARSGAVGGSVKRKIARRARNALGRLSGDGSVLVAARPLPNPLPS